MLLEIRKYTGKELIRKITGKDPDVYLLECADAGMSARAISRRLGGGVSHVTITRYLTQLGRRPGGWVKPAA